MPCNIYFIQEWQFTILNSKELILIKVKVNITSMSNILKGCNNEVFSLVSS